MKPSVSIVIPVFNESECIIECLEAISTQIVPPDEVILVDNNSTDDTILKAMHYPFVKIVNEKLQGASFARDKGFNTAKGDIIGRIDADTILSPGWVKQLKIFAEEHLEYSAFTGPVYYYDMPGERAGLTIDNFIRRSLNRFSMESKFLFGTNMAIRRSSWESIRHRVCHNSAMHEDIDLAVHLTEHGFRLAYDKKLIAGMSARRLDDSPRAFVNYLKRFKNTYAGHGIYETSSNFPIIIYLSLYPSLKILRRAYEPKSGTMSLEKLVFSEPQSRPKPD